MSKLLVIFLVIVLALVTLALYGYAHEVGVLIVGYILGILIAQLTNRQR